MVILVGVENKCKHYLRNAGPHFAANMDTSEQQYIYIVDGLRNVHEKVEIVRLPEITLSGQAGMRFAVVDAISVIYRYEVMLSIVPQPHQRKQ